MAKILTVTPNPALDIATSTLHVEPTRKLRCGPAVRHPGGGGINVARVAVRLGAHVRAIYPAGGSAGQELQALVQRDGVQSSVIPTEGATREDLTVLDETTREEFRFVLPGPYLSEPEWRQCLEALASCELRPDFICASGSLPPGAPENFYAQVAEIASLKGSRLALDTSGAALRAALQTHVHLIKPNIAELQELTGRALGEDCERVAACRQLIANGHTEIVALTLGAQGALLVTGQAAWRASPLDVHPISTVGAGDSFLGALVWALAEGFEIREAFGYGVAAGAAALLAPGTELAHAVDIRRLAPNVRIRDLGAEPAVA